MKKDGSDTYIKSDYAQLQKMVKVSMGKLPTRFEFAVAEHEEDELTGKIKHPDVTAPDAVFCGKVRLWADYWRITAAPVSSEVLEDPTWKDILSSVENLLSKHDSNYIFLESLNPRGRGKDGVLNVDLSFGS
jgi:hypothetical protein